MVAMVLVGTGILALWEVRGKGKQRQAHGLVCQMCQSLGSHEGRKPQGLPQGRAILGTLWALQ